MEMEFVLSILYPMLFFVQFILLVCAVRKPERRLWFALFWLEILCTLGAAGLTVLFEQLQGYGMMPGLTWFAEFFYSLAAAVVYGGMLLISAVVHVVKKK